MAGHHGISACRPDTDWALHCPFCASVSSGEFEIDIGYWAVACRTCGSIGPSAPSPRAAKRRWANRPPIPDTGK